MKPAPGERGGEVELLDVLGRGEGGVLESRHTLVREQLRELGLLVELVLGGERRQEQLTRRREQTGHHRQDVRLLVE